MKNFIGGCGPCFKLSCIFYDEIQGKIYDFWAEHLQKRVSSRNDFIFIINNHIILVIFFKEAPDQIHAVSSEDRL